jgi:hypothetical protein
VVVVEVEDAGRWVVVVVRVGVEVQTGETGSRSLGGAGLCCWCRFGIACRNGVEREEREPGGGKAEGKFSSGKINPQLTRKKGGKEEIVSGESTKTTMTVESTLI